MDGMTCFFGGKYERKKEKKEINSKMKIESGYGYTMVWQTERCS